MSITEDSNDDLWNTSVFSKSWADMVEEEEAANLARQNSLLKNSLILETDSKAVGDVKVPLVDENACDSHLNGVKDIVIPKSEKLPNFSISHVIKIEADSKSSKNEKVESAKDFLHEDLSLTTHFNGFQFASPCKIDKKTPVKSNIGLINKNDQLGSEVKTVKRKLRSVEAKTDEVLMPSPSKIRRENTPSSKATTTPKKTPIEKYSRKRSREITPGKSSEKKNPPRELETDPDVLSRRQKQIDYGKNTIGYERYRQLVPKESRGKMYPRTPPMHLKFSRRAWDGLIKVWRQRLHFWDPPSEGGGNPECLEIPSDISDVSSTDGSLPNTPVQDKKRARSKRGSGLNLKNQQFEALKTTPLDEDDEDDGFTPLPVE